MLNLKQKIHILFSKKIKYSIQQLLAKNPLQIVNPFPSTQAKDHRFKEPHIKPLL